MPELVVVDLEATCDADQRIARTAMEIIEIGAVRVDLGSFEIVDRFQSYIRPTIHPKLTAFCTELTGITQSQVDAAPWFAEACTRYSAWLDKAHDLTTWASWGNYDKGQFERDCDRTGAADPHAALAHLNLKTTFAKTLDVRSCGLGSAYKLLKQDMTGRHHSGLDDAVNIARLLALAPKFGDDVRRLEAQVG
jgi:inhibitor of KinA sporulation pathway (predicted exonuclease)